MGDIAISIENLGKRYRIGHAVKHPDNLGETVRSFLETSFHYLQAQLRKPTPDELFWALKDVSFEVKHGEVLGIIGRNGAGKSTLLKILSRITEPTEGQAKIYGRVGSLLEVGTGFHPELTGRENIYLNGTILGMRRTEIDREFDGIVDFAGIEKFIDTPVKRYSSGMYVRLAFAVAAHLKPEILLIDEVLAVGDIGFQSKCLGKMKEIGQEGRTVLLVSHNMASIARLCNRAVLLDSGQVRYDGNINKAIKAYLGADTRVSGYKEWTTREMAPGNEVVRLKSVKTCDVKGKIRESFDIRYPIIVEFEYWVLKEGVCLNPVFYVYNEMNIMVFLSRGTHDLKWFNRPRSIGLYKSYARIPGNFMAEGAFSITVGINTLAEGRSCICHLYEKNVTAFQVYDKLIGGSARGKIEGEYLGVVRPILEWETFYFQDGKFVHL